MNGRRLFLTLVLVALAAVLVFRHRVEQALGIRPSHVVGALASGTGAGRRGGGKSGVPSGGGAGSPGAKGSDASSAGTSTSGSNASGSSGSGSSGAGSSGNGSSGSGPSGNGSDAQGGSNGGQSQGSTPPVTSYPGAPVIESFYSDLSAGETAQAYALLAPSLTAQTTPDAFGQAYATVKSAQVQALSLQSAGNFSRTFEVTVAFTLTSGTIETKNGTVTVQDLSGGVGTADWAISDLGVAP